MNTVRYNRESPMTQNKRSGRPKIPEHEKVHYQRIAVYTEDYEKLVEELVKRKVKLTEAFAEMVAKYTSGS